MAIENDEELVSRLRRLEAAAPCASPGFDYDGLLERHSTGIARARRRLTVARGAAVGLLVALVGASFWRLDQGQAADPQEVTATAVSATVQPRAVQPRIVRADTYFAVAALEDHIATVDDALNYARVNGQQTDVARLERTRAELFDSYRRVRYAEMLSANL
jgi:hypothetical protein